MKAKRLLHHYLPLLRPVLNGVGESLARARRRVGRIRLEFIDQRSCFICLVESRFIIEIDRKLRGDIRKRALLHELAHWVCIFYFDAVDHGDKWCEIVTILGCPEEAEKYGGTPPLPIAARNCS